MIRRFGSGEIYVRPEDSVRGADVFVIQTHADPVNESIMEQLILIDAMKRASAKRITAVVPYYGYARQDKKSSRASRSARSCSPTCSPPPARIGSSRSTFTRARSRGTSTSRSTT